MSERKGPMTRRRALVGAGLMVLLAWGCEGNHAFAPVEVGPDITDLLFPSSVDSGEELSGGIRALGLVRVDSIVATLRVGSFEETKVARQETGIRPDFAAAFDFSVPTAITDTLGSVEAYAVDAQSNVGPLSAVTIRTIDTAAPTVGLTLSGDRIGLGTQVPVTIFAEDNIGLTQIGFQVIDASGEIIAEVFVPADGTSVSRTLLFDVPSDLPLGGVTVVGIAVDHEGLIAFGEPVPITLVDVDLPEVQVVTPDDGDFAPAQDSLFTSVLIRDNDAVDSVTIDGVAHRGDRSLGTDTVVVRFQPRTIRFDPATADTLLQRFILPAADSTAENAFIRAVAYDREGNVSRDSVQISLFIDDVPPFVEIQEPDEDAIQGVGDSILVQTLIRELPAPIRSGVTSLKLEGLAFRGDPELGTFHTVERFLSRTVTLDPPQVENFLVSRYLPAAGGTESEYVHMIATATDAWGNQRADTVRIRLVNDTIAPNIQIHQPSSGASRTAGDSVFISATVFEGSGLDESGVASIIVDGVSYRVNPGFGGVDQIGKFRALRLPFTPPVDDVPLSIWLQPSPDTSLEDVWLRVFATDAVGNTSVDSVMVTLTAPPPAPPAPEIGMLMPAVGFPAGGANHPGGPGARTEPPEVARLGASHGPRGRYDRWRSRQRSPSHGR